MIVRLDEPDILYFVELTKDWTIQDNLASKYPKRQEAEMRAVQLAMERPELIQKLQVKNFYHNGLEYEQKDLF